jgi:hypothetical protein
MEELDGVAPAFIEMAHRIVWATAVTVDTRSRPRARILHPIWQWDGSRLVGWIATSPTPLKRAHLAEHPFMSITYWSPSHDTCTAECQAVLCLDDETRRMVWNLFANGPQPVGYEPSIVPAWTSPTSEHFAAIRLDPWRLRVFPGTLMVERTGEILVWEDK